MQLSLQRDRLGAWCVVTVEGEIDLSNSSCLHNCIAEEIAFGARSLVLDLARLWFVDASGLRVFREGKFLTTQRGGTLILTRPTIIVKRVLDVCGFETVCTIYEAAA